MEYLLFKIGDQLVKPSNVLMIACALALLLVLLIRRRWPVRIASLTFAVTLGASVIPVGEWLLVPLENRFPAPAAFPDKVDGIAVISERINGEVSRARGGLVSVNHHLTTMIELARRYPEAKIVLTGIGESTSAHSMSHAEIVRDFLERQGFDPGRIAFEDKARSNPRDTVVKAFETARPGPGERWLLVATALEMPRSVGVARKLGWQVEPWPVAWQTTGHYEPVAPHLRPTLYLWMLDEAVHEWLTLGAYKAGGWTETYFPGPEPNGGFAVAKYGERVER